MHRPFVTTVKFENENGGAMRFRVRRRRRRTADAKAELERRFLDLEVDRYTIERIVEAATLQARMLKLPPRCVMLLLKLHRYPTSRGKRWPVFRKKKSAQSVNNCCSVFTMPRSEVCRCRLAKCRRKGDRRLPCSVIVGAISKARPWPLRLGATKKISSTQADLSAARFSSSRGTCPPLPK